MRELGSQWASRWSKGDIVALYGELGAGKTTFVRGVLEGLGHVGPVRSPTFNLLQTFENDPPVLHADLYRLESGQGIGLEEYFDSHLCLIEWPDRLGKLIPTESCWRVEIEFQGEGRLVSIFPPQGTDPGLERFDSHR